MQSVTSCFFRSSSTVHHSSASVTSAENWPQLRGRDGSGIAERQNLPDDWNVDSGEKILWSLPISGLAHSSPIVWDDHAYLTTTSAAGAEVSFGTGDSNVVGSGSTDDHVSHEWEFTKASFI